MPFKNEEMEKESGAEEGELQMIEPVIIEREKDLDVCRGIFIDIFPLDGICPSGNRDRLQKTVNNFLIHVYILA